MLFNLHLRPNEPSHTGTLHRHSQHDVFSLHTVLSPRAPACETSPPPCHTHPLRLPRNLQTDRSPPQRAINHNVIGVPVPTLWHNLVAQCSCVEKNKGLLTTTLSVYRYRPRGTMLLCCYQCTIHITSALHTLSHTVSTNHKSRLWSSPYQPRRRPSCAAWKP